MLARIAPHFFLAAGLILIGLAVYDYAGRRSGPALIVPQTDIEVPDVEPGQDAEVAIGLENHSSGPIRVVGLGQC